MIVLVFCFDRICVQYIPLSPSLSLLRARYWHLTVSTGTVLQVCKLVLRYKQCGTLLDVPKSLLLQRIAYTLL